MRRVFFSGALSGPFPAPLVRFAAGPIGVREPCFRELSLSSASSSASDAVRPSSVRAGRDASVRA